MNEEHITRITLEQAKIVQDLTDWERVNTMSEEEVEENALSDPDNQPMSEDFIKGDRVIRRNRSLSRSKPEN